MKANPLLLLCLKALLLTLLVLPLAAQEDDFNDGNDTGWTRFSPLAPLGGTSFGFSAGAYQLACNASPSVSLYGPARCGSLRADKVYLDFCVMVDIVNFNPAENTSMGVLARVQPNPGPAAVNGYAFTYQSADRNVQISRVVSEAPANLGDTPLTLTAGQSYRIVFFGIGSHLEGRVYDRAFPLLPLQTVVATDSTYTQGMSGVVIFSETNTRASASFDNYSASDGTPPPLQVGVGLTGEIEVSWNLWSGLCSQLESSVDLFQWQPLPALPVVVGRGYRQDGNRTVFSQTIEGNGPAHFYRLRTGPIPISN
jgi:hypothetical protein